MFCLFIIFLGTKLLIFKCRCYTTTIKLLSLYRKFASDLNNFVIISFENALMCSLSYICTCSSASASGNGTNSPFKFKKPISLKAGKNEIALLSMTVGLQVSFPFFISVNCFSDCKTLTS